MRSELVGLDNKNSSKDYEKSLKQVKTANPNSPWAYIWEGLLSEGYLRLRFGGLIFGRAYLFIYLFIYFWGVEGLLSEFYGKFLATHDSAIKASQNTDVP